MASSSSSSAAASSLARPALRPTENTMAAQQANAAIKKENMTLPILLRESEGTAAKVTAAYGECALPLLPTPLHAHRVPPWLPLRVWH